MTYLQDLKDAAECVVKTATGNVYGLSEGEQLEALRAAADTLCDALYANVCRSKADYDADRADMQHSDGEDG